MGAGSVIEGRTVWEPVCGRMAGLNRLYQQGVCLEP